MAAIFPGAVATQLQLLTAQNNSMVVLDANCDLDDDVISVDDASALPTSGYLTFVDTDEVIYYSNKTSNTLTGVVRGADGTAAASHLAGVDIEQRWNADYHNIITLEQVAVEQYLSDRFGITSSIIVPTGKVFTITDGLGIGATVDSKAILSLSSTTKGFLPPVMTTTQRDAISSPSNGLIIYNSTTSALNIYRSSAWKAVLVPGLADIVNADIASGAAIAYSKLALTGSILNADINASAAIAYSKLALTGAILNADLAGSIAYSKLVLTTSIVNGDISASAAIAQSKLALSITNSEVNASAAIARSKLAALTASRLMVTDGSGFDSVNSVTATEAGYLSGVTSAIQTQFTAKASLAGDTFTGNIIVDNQKEVRFREASGGGTNYFGIKAAAAMSADVTVILPNAAPTANLQVLRVSDYTTGALEWGTGGGSGGINYISTNPDAEAGTSGWAVYADAAGTTPVDGTGGSPSLTITRTTSSPLRGTGMFTLTKGATNRQGDGGSYDFTIDAADKATVVQISFDYQVSSAFVAGDSSDVRMFIYDVTNAVLITPAPYTIQGGNGTPHKFVSTFQTAYNSTSYRLIFHVATTNASAWTMDFDNVIVGPQKSAWGAPVSDSTAITLGSNGIGTISSYAVYSQRVGDKLRVFGTFTLGSTSGSTAYLSLPAGYTIDYTKQSANAGGTYVGMYAAQSSSGTPANYWSANNAGILFIDGSDTGKIFFTLQTVSSAFKKDNGNVLLNASQPCSIWFEVPITGWASNVLMSADTDTRVVAMSAYNASSQSFTNNTQADITNWTTENDTHGMFVASTGVYTIPVSGWYTISGQIRWNANSTGIRSIQAAKNGSTSIAENVFNNPSGTLATGVNVVKTVFLTAGDNVRLNAYQNSGGALALQSTTNYCTFSIFRVSGPASIAATETVSCRYNSTAGNSLAGNTDALIDFATKEWDSHGAVTTGASWKFTAPVSGVYDVSAFVAFSGTSSAINGANGNEISLQLWKNGSLFSYLNMTTIQNTTANVWRYGGNSKVKLLAGEYIDIRTRQDTGSTQTLTVSSVVNWITVNRIGNY